MKTKNLHNILREALQVRMDFDRAVTIYLIENESKNIRLDSLNESQLNEFLGRMMSGIGQGIAKFKLNRAQDAKAFQDSKAATAAEIARQRGLEVGRKQRQLDRAVARNYANKFGLQTFTGASQGDISKNLLKYARRGISPGRAEASYGKRLMRRGTYQEPDATPDSTPDSTPDATPAARTAKTPPPADPRHATDRTGGTNSFKPNGALVPTGTDPKLINIALSRNKNTNTTTDEPEFIKRRRNPTTNGVTDAELNVKQLGTSTPTVPTVRKLAYTRTKSEESPTTSRQLALPAPKPDPKTDPKINSTSKPEKFTPDKEVRANRMKLRKGLASAGINAAGLKGRRLSANQYRRIRSEWRKEAGGAPQARVAFGTVPQNITRNKKTGKPVVDSTQLFGQKIVESFARFIAYKLNESEDENGEVSDTVRDVFLARKQKKAEEKYQRLSGESGENNREQALGGGGYFRNGKKFLPRSEAAKANRVARRAAKKNK